MNVTPDASSKYSSHILLVLKRHGIEKLIQVVLQAGGYGGGDPGHFAVRSGTLYRWQCVSCGEAI